MCAISCAHNAQPDQSKFHQRFWCLLPRTQAHKETSTCLKVKYNGVWCKFWKRSMFCYKHIIFYLKGRNITDYEDW